MEIPGDKKESALTAFACPACGAGMVYSPAARALTCAHCGRKDSIPDTRLGTGEQTWNDNGNEETAWAASGKITLCRSCGASLTVPAGEESIRCGWCHSAQVDLDPAGKGVRPGGLLPFTVDLDSAVQLYKRWVSRRPFAPGALKRMASLARIEGFYLPAWTFDADTHSVYTAMAGTRYTRAVTRTENGQTVTSEETDIRWEPVSGSFSRAFDDVLVNASRAVDEKLWRRITPFDLENLTDYNAAYLAGFRAFLYTVDRGTAWITAQNMIRMELEQQITQTIAADEVKDLHVDTRTENITWKHILLPVWSAVYRYNGKDWRFLVNGRNGKVQGYAPVSAAKIILLIAGILLLAGALLVTLVLTGLIDLGPTGAMIRKTAGSVMRFFNNIIPW